MADEEREEEKPAADPVELLKSLEKRAGINKILMITVIVISSVVITVMATGMTVMFLRISSLTEATEVENEDPMEEQFIALEQQLMLLADFRKSEVKKIAAFTKQLETIGNDCSLEKAAPYNDFLTSREADFQMLLTIVKSGASNLAGMSKGSKKWLDAHNQSLDKLKDLSIERKNKLDSIVKRRN